MVRCNFKNSATAVTYSEKLDMKIMQHTDQHVLGGGRLGAGVYAPF